ncbi:hypothetical protein RSOLAG1IB_09620 [Rhizoctonia solani AG-1 IB]|uniref:Uncharacterized protein n=1 Tax=Thanatephorus cucumeris (strain AG1-IB / isolate 7/3/14) TaxID=1108050 RepID=A0A0B7FU63_THACB|nr:hypothetical protein RSOLAG1IB_09620 [Rhizoctonia solani AG-1 IB]
MPSEAQNMVNAALRRREELERREEARQQREDSPPPANQILSDITDQTSEGGECEDSQERNTPARETPSRRRRRSPSMDLDTPEGRQHKYACFTEAQCDRFALRGSRRSLVKDFAKGDCHEKMISIMAFLQRSESEQAGSDVQAYLASGAFKAHATALFYTAIVAPHSKAYVTSLASFIASDMARNYPLYKIDKSIIEDEEARSTLNTHMRNKLTTMRNAIKEKLEAAADGAYCMNQLMSDIMPGNIQIRLEHRQRWAWILAQYKAQRETSPTTSNFWKNIDKVLADTEDALAATVADKEAIKEIRAEIFKEALENHERDYPTAIPPPEEVDAPSWQIMLERTMDKFHRY